MLGFWAARGLGIAHSVPGSSSYLVADFPQCDIVAEIAPGRPRYCVTQQGSSESNAFATAAISQSKRAAQSGDPSGAADPPHCTLRPFAIGSLTSAFLTTAPICRYSSASTALV